jgi:hypothetical protein
MPLCCYLFPFAGVHPCAHSSLDPRGSDCPLCQEDWLCFAERRRVVRNWRDFVHNYVIILCTSLSRSARVVALSAQVAVKDLIDQSLANQQNISRGVRSKTIPTASPYIADKARRAEGASKVSHGVVTTEAVVAALSDKGFNVVAPHSVSIDASKVSSRGSEARWSGFVATPK